MKRCSLILLLASPASLLLAQGGAPSIAQDLNQAYMGIKNNILQAAEKMPAEDYSFQPTNQERTFGGWVAHVADSQMNACSGIAGQRQQLNASSKTTKDDLIAALKESFDACDAVYKATTDANVSEAVQSFRGQTARAAALYGTIAHDQECYGTMAVYLRLKGIVPPSTENMGKMMKGKKKE